MGIIFYISHQSDPIGGFTIPVNDKVIHGGEYFVIHYLAMRAFQYSSTLFIKNKYVMWSLIFSLLFAMSDELHQLCIVGRDGSYFDFCADAIGIIISMYLFSNYTYKGVVQ